MRVYRPKSYRWRLSRLFSWESNPYGVVFQDTLNNRCEHFDDNLWSWTVAAMLNERTKEQQCTPVEKRWGVVRILLLDWKNHRFRVTDSSSPGEVLRRRSHSRGQNAADWTLAATREEISCRLVRMQPWKLTCWRISEMISRGKWWISTSSIGVVIAKSIMFWERSAYWCWKWEKQRRALPSFLSIRLRADWPIVRSVRISIYFSKERWSDHLDTIDDESGSLTFHWIE